MLSKNYSDRKEFPAKSEICQHKQHLIYERLRTKSFLLIGFTLSIINKLLVCHKMEGYFGQLILVLLLTTKVSCIGVLGNIFNIDVLISNRRTSNFTKTFLKLLIILSIFDLLYLIVVISLFGLPALCPWYNENVYFKILPNW